MRGTNRNNALCFASLEQALAENTETYGHIDLLCAGWPCQDNSIAGKRAGHKGKRSGLWSEVRRIIGIFYPQWVILENVPGLFSVNNGKDFWNVISDLDSLGYCVAWDVLDSQFFGVAQRRKRVFIIGSFGNIGASQILFEPESSRRNDKKVKKMGQRGVCISTRDGERHDPTSETLIASTIGTSTNPDPHYGTHFIAERIGALTAKSYGDKGWAPANEWNTVIAPTIKSQDYPRIGNKGAVKHNFVAQTLGATPRGDTSFIWQDTHIAEINSDRKRTVTRIPLELHFSGRLDSVRGIVIGNAVTVNVAKWIGERIMKYEMQREFL